jgi:hypothetical protein
MRAVLFLAMLAATLASATAGGAPTNADQAAAKRISSHIQQSGQLRHYRIGVTFKNGVATLEGNVASVEQREAAIRLAQQVKGVEKVECKLQSPAEDTKAPQEQAKLRASDEMIEASTEAGTPGAAMVKAPSYMPPPPRPQVRQAAAQRQAPMRPRMNGPMMQRPRAMPRSNMPLPQRRFISDPSVRQTSAYGVQHAGGPYGYEGAGAPLTQGMGGGMMGGQAVPVGFVPHASARGPSYENAQMPGYAWPSYASYPNYAALSYPQQYSPTAWPYIGPFYPYPQVPLAWRKVSLEWDDGWWFLDFSAHNSSH